jgi:uncharacterized protein
MRISRGSHHAQRCHVHLLLDQAVEWFKKAADQGNLNAQTNMGHMYKNGDGVPQDLIEAVKWYKKAADQGNEYARKELSKMGVAVK